MKNGLVKDIKRNYQFYIMTLPALAVVILFIYTPMYGVQLALKDYKFLQGVSGSEWIGIAHFKKFFSTYSFWQVIGNTLRISFSAIVFGFPPPILFALLLNEVKNERFKKSVQTVTYIPHFISTTVLVAMMFAFSNQTTGIINIFLTKLGLQSQPFMQSEKWFVF
ncbi:MAG: sugar ABC transporter permease, partial [Clostridia bacterium]|nr:sugar ABC transporter permease [Clostridia bacterium]